MNTKQHFFVSMSIDDLQTLIIDCVNSCLKHHNDNRKYDKKDIKKAMWHCYKDLINDNVIDLDYTTKRVQNYIQKLK